jgi:3'-phosphoadenosine 5'-phosphosulfate sulfotransferase (PAPS reductase)/FAD synthetase
MYYVVSFSGGKDSTAMLLRLMELGEPIDEVLFCDTYKEFPQMYEHIKKIRKVVENKGIKFTELKSEKSFDYYMFEHNPKRKKDIYKGLLGYSWAGSRSRWCSGRLKIEVIDKYLKELNKQYKVLQYIGLAADETKRLERENNLNPNHIHPLAVWGWTEQDCLNYCYALGYDWGGLYNYFSRVSCWCCPLQSLEELRKLRKYFPELWKELKDMDNRTWRKFRADYSVEELDKRFVFEEQRLAEGKSIRNKEFYKELKELLGNAADTFKA